MSKQERTDQADLWGNYTHPILPRTIQDVMAVVYAMQHTDNDGGLDTEQYNKGKQLMGEYKLVYVYHDKDADPAKPKNCIIVSPLVQFKNPLREGQIQSCWLAKRKQPKPNKA